MTLPCAFTLALLEDDITEARRLARHMTRLERSELSEALHDGVYLLGRLERP